jgi:RNA polymerase sigma factor (sigma-70 family)
VAPVIDDESNRTPGIEPRRDPTVLPFPGSALPALTGEEAFTAMFTRMYAPLCAYAEDFVNADVAEDVVQSTLVAVWRQYLKDGKEPGESPDSLAFLAVQYRIKDWRRGRYREARRLGVYLKEMPGRVRRWLDPEARLEERELVNVIDGALGHMTPRCRQVFILRRESGLSLQRIAELDGVSQETVRSLMHKAQLTLREHLVRAGFSPSAVRWRGGKTSRKSGKGRNR